MREEHLRLALERLSQVAVEVGRIGPGVLQLAQEQPLRREIRDERVGARVGEHSPDLPLERVGILQPATRRNAQQLIVRNAAPEKERQPRGQLEIGHSERCAGRRLRRLALEPEEELRIDENASDRPLDAELERLLTPGAIELEQHVDVAAG